MDNRDFDFIHTVDRPTVEQLRRELERVDAAQQLVIPAEEAEVGNLISEAYNPVFGEGLVELYRSH